MPSPNATPTPITPPRVPIIDPRTGLIDRAWYMFFLSLFNAAVESTDTALAPNTISLIASYDAALQALTQNVDSQPSQFYLLSQTAELQKQIDALQQHPAGLLDQIAELQKQVQALELKPSFNFGAIAFENIGLSGTATLAKITTLGANGSLTFTNGIITAYVAPT